MGWLVANFPAGHPRSDVSRCSRSCEWNVGSKFDFKRHANSLSPPMTLFCLEFRPRLTFNKSEVMARFQLNMSKPVTFMTFPETYHVTVLALSQLKGAQGHDARVAICIAPTVRHCGLKGRGTGRPRRPSHVEQQAIRIGKGWEVHLKLKKGEIE